MIHGSFATARCLIALLTLGMAATAAARDSADADFALTGTVFGLQGRPLAGALGRNPGNENRTSACSAIDAATQMYRARCS